MGQDDTDSVNSASTSGTVSLHRADQLPGSSLTVVSLEHARVREIERHISAYTRDLKMIYGVVVNNFEIAASALSYIVDVSTSSPRSTVNMVIDNLPTLQTPVAGGFPSSSDYVKDLRECVLVPYVA